MNNSDYLIYALIGIAFFIVGVFITYLLIVSAGKRALIKTNDLLAAIASKLGTTPEELELIMKKEDKPII